MSNHSVFARVGDFASLQRTHCRKSFVDPGTHFPEEIICKLHPTDVQGKTKIRVTEEVLLKTLPQ